MATGIIRLTELEPRWISDHVFVFKCPHCREWWLSCKNLKMTNSEQHELFQRVYGGDWNGMVVGCDESTQWLISSRDFSHISVSPSIDASASGHWHGTITNGECK